MIQDIATLLDGMPDGRRIGDVAMVDAARGAYGVRAVGGIVTAFARCTPTDHLCAQGGVLQRSLASLPTRKAHPSPCVPVRVARHA